MRLINETINVYHYMIGTKYYAINVTLEGNNICRLFGDSLQEVISKAKCALEETAIYPTIEFAELKDTPESYFESASIRDGKVIMALRISRDHIENIHGQARFKRVRDLKEYVLGKHGHIRELDRIEAGIKKKGLSWSALVFGHHTTRMV